MMPAKKLTLYLGVAAGFTGFSILGLVLSIRRKRCSELHTFGSMIRQHFEYFIFSLIGRRMRRKLENDSMNFVEVQEETLLKILKNNATTEYGVKYKFREIDDKMKYIALHPLTRYAHYEPYVGRQRSQLNGYSDVLIQFRKQPLNVFIVKFSFWNTLSISNKCFKGTDHFI